MRKPLLFAVFFLALALPERAPAQNIALGARAGFVGFGAEVAVELAERVVARGGIGFFPFELPEIAVDDFDFTVTPPSSFITAGLDFYPFGNSLRLMGGMLFRSGNVEIEAPALPGDELGDIVLDESGTLFGELDQGSSGPFVGIGLGKHTRGGFGVFMDLAVAFMGTAGVNLSVSESLQDIPEIDGELSQLESDAEEEAGAYLEYWPVLSLGVKIPIGG